MIKLLDTAILYLSANHESVCLELEKKEKVMHFPCYTAATLAVNQTVISSLIHRFSATKLLSIILVRAHLEHLGTSVGVCGVCTAILNMQL